MIQRTSLPPPNRHSNIPLLSRKEVVEFVETEGLTIEGALVPGQILRHPDGISNVRITHPTQDETVLWAYCIACKKVVNEATMNKHGKVGNKDTCKNHPALSRVAGAAIAPSSGTAPNITTGATSNTSGIIVPATFGIDIHSGIIGDGEGVSDPAATTEEVASNRNRKSNQKSKRSKLASAPVAPPTRPRRNRTTKSNK